VLLAAEIFALSSRRPYLNGFFLLFGWFIVYFFSGIILPFGLEAIKEFLSNPRPIDFYIETVVVLLSIWLALRTRRTGEPKGKKRSWMMPLLLLALAGLLLVDAILFFGTGKPLF
jgi:hypothetical protein